VTHTSDYFDELYDLAVKLIKSGKAYADDTEQLQVCSGFPKVHVLNTDLNQMRHERMEGLPSKHRDDSVDDNLKHFTEMKAGTQEGLRWCIRAKISVDNPNKAMRDPVIYRCNVLTHHRTGYV
jgi:glutamyl-tRNA synthetase